MLTRPKASNIHTKQIIEGRIEGRREKERLRVTYEDKVKEIARRRGKGMRNLKRMGKERDERRKCIEADPTP